MAVPVLRWLFSVMFVLGYSLMVVLSAAVVCWAIFVLPLPPLLTVIASIEQVLVLRCHGNTITYVCVTIISM